MFGSFRRRNVARLDKQIGDMLLLLRYVRCCVVVQDDVANIVFVLLSLLSLSLLLLRSFLMLSSVLVLLLSLSLLYYAMFLVDC